MKKKGYVRLTTNLGDLNLELHCDMVSNETIRELNDDAKVKGQHPLLWNTKIALSNLPR